MNDAAGGAFEAGALESSPPPPPPPPHADSRSTISANGVGAAHRLRAAPGSIRSSRGNPRLIGGHAARILVVVIVHPLCWIRLVRQFAAGLPKYTDTSWGFSTTLARPLPWTRVGDGHVDVVTGEGPQVLYNDATRPGTLQAAPRLLT